MDGGNPSTPGPRTRTAHFSQEKPARKKHATYTIPRQSLPHREMGGVDLEKKMGGGHSQTTSSTLGNSLADPIGAGPSHTIRGPIKGGGHGIIPNAHRGHRPERLAGGDPSPQHYPGLPLRMACADSASCFATLSEARKIGPDSGMRHREDRRHPPASRMRKARGSLARPCRRIRPIQGGSRDRDGGYKGI
jgi:hypothetical protein